MHGKCILPIADKTKAVLEANSSYKCSCALQLTATYKTLCEYFLKIHVQKFTKLLAVTPLVVCQIES